MMAFENAYKLKIQLKCTNSKLLPVTIFILIIYVFYFKWCEIMLKPEIWILAAWSEVECLYNIIVYNVMLSALKVK